MTEEHAGDEPLYFEPGASWWAVLFGPAFAALGVGAELISTGPIYWGLWIGVAGVLGLFAMLWVYARRRFAVVRVTHQELTQGSERLPVSKIKAVFDSDDEPPGVRVLGGGQSVPRRYTAVHLKLTDGSRVLAWARDGDGLRAALRTASGA